MKNLITVVAILVSFAAFGQNIVNREIKSFDKIEVKGNISVEMTQGNKESIEIKAINVDPSEVETEVKDKLLKIKMKSNLFDENVKVKIKLTYKEIRKITSNASAEIKILDKIEGDKIFANATSGGRILMKVDLEPEKGMQEKLSKIELLCKEECSLKKFLSLDKLNVKGILPKLYLIVILSQRRFFSI